MICTPVRWSDQCCRWCWPYLLLFAQLGSNGATAAVGGATAVASNGGGRGSALCSPLLAVGAHGKAESGMPAARHCCTSCGQLLSASCNTGWMVTMLSPRRKTWRRFLVRFSAFLFHLNFSTCFSSVTKGSPGPTTVNDKFARRSTR